MATKPVDAETLEAEFDAAGFMPPSIIESNETSLSLHFNGSFLRATAFTLKMGGSESVNWAVLDIIRKYINPPLGDSHVSPVADPAPPAGLKDHTSFMDWVCDRTEW